MSLLEIEAPEVTIDHCNHHRGRQNYDRGAEVMKKCPFKAQRESRYVEGHTEGKHVIQPAELDLMLALEPPPKQHEQAVKARNGHGQDQTFVALGQFWH